MKVLKKIGELIAEYFDWILEDLPPLIGAVLLAVSVGTPIFGGMYVISKIATNVEKSYCLDSAYPRRFSPYACEEYIDGEWVEIEPGKDKSYTFNERGIKVND